MKRTMNKFNAALSLLVAAVLVGLTSKSIAATDVTGTRLNVGQGHTLTGTLATIAGGETNKATTNYAVILGGFKNTASGFGSMIGGGLENIVTSSNAVIVGGYENTNTAHTGFIGAGYFNVNEGNFGASAIVAGYVNRNKGAFATIAGGGANHIGTNAGASTYGGDGMFIGAGTYNTNIAAYSFIGGGYRNYATGFGQFLGAGQKNYVDSVSGSSGMAVLMGGQENKIETYGEFAVIGGGIKNTNRASGSVISGGSGNLVDGGEFSGIYSTIGGG